MDEKETVRSGNAGNVAPAGSTVLAILQNRLELLAVELQEERVRLFNALLLRRPLWRWDLFTLAMAARRGGDDDLERIRRKGTVRTQRAGSRQHAGGLVAAAGAFEELAVPGRHAGRTQKGPRRFGTQEMTTLQLRKKTLLLESGLNRLTLRAECERLREAADLAGRLQDTRRQIAPWALVLAPLAGVALALGLRRSRSGTGFWTRALEIAPALIQLWRTCVPPSDESK